MNGSDLVPRHGWGCTPDPAKAVTYLSAAASNAASVEELALQAGMKKGGAAKGELVLAIFELANCFRHGWGVTVDKFAAKQVRQPDALDPEQSYDLTSHHDAVRARLIYGSVLRNSRKSGRYGYVAGFPA